MNLYALCAIGFLATGPVLALATTLGHRLSVRLHRFPEFVLGVFILSSIGGIANHLIDYWDVGILALWFLVASSMVDPLWKLLDDSGGVEFTFAWTWRRVIPALGSIVWNLVPIGLFGGLFGGNPTLRLKVFVVGSLYGIAAFRDFVDTKVELRTTGVRVGVQLYPWENLGSFQWADPPWLGTPALEIQTPSDVNKKVRIRWARDL